MTGSLQLKRCFTLLSQDKGAATAFYSRLHQHAGVPSSAKMLAMLVRCAVGAARAKDEAEKEEEKSDLGGGGRERGGKKGKRKGSDGDDEREKGRSAGQPLMASDSKVSDYLLLYLLIVCPWLCDCFGRVLLV